MSNSVYGMAINNVANYVNNTLSKDAKPDGYDKKEPAAFDVFEASSVLSVVFCKNKEEIVADIIKAQLDKES